MYLLVMHTRSASGSGYGAAYLEYMLRELGRVDQHPNVLSCWIRTCEVLVTHTCE